MSVALVTGAGGFAGTWLCRELLAHGHEVVGWVRRAPAEPVPGVDYRVQDIADAAGCARGIAEVQPGVVYHLAAVTHLGEAEADPGRAHAVNVGGTANVLAPLPDGVPAVFASTCHVYGPPQRLPMGEDHPCSPRGVYARSKLEAETVARRVHPAVVIARAFHHLGPGQSHRFAFADWALRLGASRRRGEPAHLVVGDIDIRRDYCDVRDIVAGYRVLASSGQAGGTYNLCSGRAPLLRELIQAMAGGATVTIEVDPSRQRPGIEPELRGDPAKALALGWRPERDLGETLRALVEAALGAGCLEDRAR